MQRFLNYFTQGTQDTVTAGKIGIEIETDFTFADGTPITETVSQHILRSTFGKPHDSTLKLELGRQKIEINIEPQVTFKMLWERTQCGLKWLYTTAAEYGAQPVFQPIFSWPDPLLYVQEERDEIWVQLDGRSALEHLCRCSAVQFTIDVNPKDAIPFINALHRSTLVSNGFKANDKKWQQYMADTTAKYAPLRYGGPKSFLSLEDYVTKLTEHKVVMHKSQPVYMRPEDVNDLNIDLYLRSIWWHYRLRRYGNSLCLEIRPFPRLRDEDIPQMWQTVADILKTALHPQLSIPVS